MKRRASPSIVVYVWKFLTGSRNDPSYKMEENMPCVWLVLVFLVSELVATHGEIIMSSQSTSLMRNKQPT